MKEPAHPSSLRKSRNKKFSGGYTELHIEYIPTSLQNSGLKKSISVSFLSLMNGVGR
jgi:hypothetical protein